MKTGIQENTECMRCGTCCVYYSITPCLRIPNKKELAEYYKDAEKYMLKRTAFIKKKKGEVCKFLEYDLDSKIATCQMRNNPKHPIECKKYFCNQHIFTDTVRELKKTFENMPEIMAKHLNSQVVNSHV